MQGFSSIRSVSNSNVEAARTNRTITHDERAVVRRRPRLGRRRGGLLNLNLSHSIGRDSSGFFFCLMCAPLSLAGMGWIYQLVRFSREATSRRTTVGDETSKTPTLGRSWRGKRNLNVVRNHKRLRCRLTRKLLKLRPSDLV